MQHYQTDEVEILRKRVIELERELSMLRDLSRSKEEMLLKILHGEQRKCKQYERQLGITLPCDDNQMNDMSLVHQYNSNSSIDDIRAEPSCSQKSFLQMKGEETSESRKEENPNRS